MSTDADDTEHSGSENRESEPPLPLLASALRTPPLPHASLLPKIQERIYQRTRGRYFRPKKAGLRDPITLALLIALVLAVIATATFMVFVPLFDSLR